MLVYSGLFRACFTNERLFFAHLKNYKKKCNRHRKPVMMAPNWAQLQEYFWLKETYLTLWAWFRALLFAGIRLSWYAFISGTTTFFFDTDLFAVRWTFDNLFFRTFSFLACPNRTATILDLNNDECWMREGFSFSTTTTATTTTTTAATTTTTITTETKTTTTTTTTTLSYIYFWGTLPNVLLHLTLLIQ